MQKKRILAILLIPCVTIFTVYMLMPIPEYIYQSDFEPIPTESDNILELHRYYEGVERYPTLDYAVYVFDERDDEYLGKLAREIVEDYSLDREKINAVARYVQEIPYTEDEEEYPQFPVETIMRNGGDCEDKSILGASLLDLLGYNVSLIRLEGHMVVGVNIGIGHYDFLEVVGKGWELGEKPDNAENPIFHTITNRPLVFHEWGDITLYTDIRLKKFVEGSVTIYNLGRDEANLTLKIFGTLETVNLLEQNKGEIEFKLNIGDRVLKTELYLSGELVEEKYENGVCDD